MSSSNLVAFILGAGTNIGASVAATLRENGYRVALGSRNPKPDTDNHDQSYFHVKVDVQRPESITSAFESVVNKLGPVNVVIYNAASFIAPPVANDPLSLSAEAVYDSASIGLGAFTAAKEALASFRNEVHRNHPKAFIATGNLLPFDIYASPAYFTLGLQKAVETRLIATSAKAYESEGIRFYFATLVSKEGGHTGMPVFNQSGPTHARVYWDLINGAQSNWDHRFTIDGDKYPHDA
ncbi:hypothetical protein B0H34DRAFT_719881 [Crassisporium funariophilum]|nr:hypothetical protein B0H34DRAFT_719881 [Crassisporium funariophilum]